MRPTRLLLAAATLGLLALAQPAATQQPTSAGARKAGRPIVIGRSYTVPSRILGGERRINVYLPPGYSDPKKRFPVLFLLDGGEAEDFLHIAGAAQVVAANGFYQEMIVVGIEGVDRRHDLTSPSSVAEERADYPTTGASAAYRRFLVDELKPWVAARYRGDGKTAIIGESLAGLFIVETLLRAPESFDDYIAASPSLWWSDQALSREAETDLKAHSFTGKRLWMSIGDEGTTMQAGADRVAAALKAVAPAGLTWTYDPRPQERHDTIYQPVALSALRAFYPIPKPAR